MLFKKKSKDVRSPLDLDYLRILRAILQYMNSWPHRAVNEKVPKTFFRNKKFMVIYWELTLLSCLWVVKKNIGLSIIEIGECYITIFINLIGQYRSFIAWFAKSYSEVTRDFVLKIHLFHHQHKSDVFKKMHNRVDRICRLFVMLIMGQMPFGIMMYNLPPVISNYIAGMYSSDPPANRTFALSFSVEVPYFDVYNDFRTYIFTSIVQLYLTIDCAVAFFIYDLYTSIIVFHVWGHLKILIKNLKNFPKCSTRGEYQKEPLQYSPEEQKVVKKLLAENIKHHQMIVGFMRRFAETFGSSYAMYYLFQQISLCISLLACSSLNAHSLLKYGTLTMLMAEQLIQGSLVVELIGAQSESLVDAVYGVPWQYMSNSNRKMVALFLMNAQTPLSIKGMGMVPVGVRTMASILKSSFSYFMLLRTFAMEQTD